MNKNYLLVSVLFLMQVFSVSAQDNIDPSEIADESTRLFAGGELDDFNKAFSGPNNTTNFPSETLFSLSDIGRKTYHMYRSTNYRLTRLANYQPLPAATATNEALSSPMLKITGSSITVDLNGFHLSRQTTDVDGVTTVNAVGIEIGYSPYDAAQGKFGLTAGATFATVSQPENITIRNGRIDNFGIGIVIHAGVKNVTLENLTISNAALGVVCAGQADKPAVSIFLKNVRIESDGTDKSAVLAWAKLKLESNAVNVGNMNYGDGTLMPEQVSPVGAEGTTLNVYSGILLVNTNNVSVYDVGCTNLGYARTVDENSTAEVIPSATFAINAIGCTSLQLEKIDASNNASERLVSGINISGCSAVTMTDVVATNNHIVVPRENDVDADIPLTPTITFGLWARGVSILSSQAVTINGLEVSRTLGASSVNGALAGTKSTAMGLYLDTIKVLNAQNIQSDYNDSQLASAGLTFGIYTEDLDSGVYEHISASSNTGAASTSAVLNNGSVVGMYFAGVCKDVQLKDISCNTNNSSSRYSAVRGISFASVNAASVPSIFETITLENVSACNNTQTHANGDEFVAGIYFGAAVTNLTMKNVHADKNSKSTAGNAYGMHFYNAITTGVFENVTADNNTAVGNAYGIQIMQPSANLVFDNCSFSVNSGAPGQGLRFNSTATNVTVQNSRMDGNSGTFGGGFNCGDAINVVIDNCSISNTSGSSPKAIQLNSALNVKLHRVKADRTNGTGATYGLYIVTTAQALEVKDCSFDGITTSGGASYGMYFTGEADNVQLRGVDMLRVVGTTGGTKGIYFQNAGNNVTIQDTNIVGVTGTTTNPVGAIFFDSTATNVKLNNVHVDSTQSSTATCYGLVIDDAANNIEIKNSSFDNTNATGAGIVYGINIASSAGVKALTMENVTADYTNGTSATTVYGMYIHAASGVNAKNISANNTSGVFARGIAFMGSCKNAYIDGLQASGTTSSGSTATSNNLRIEAGDGVTLKNAQCNGLVNSSGEFAAYSIDFVTSAQNIVLENVESNNGLNSTHDMYGIYINTGNTVSLKNVSASGNVSTDDSAYGIYFATSASNIYMDTVSANNNDGNINAEGVYFATLDIGSLQNVTANNNGNSSVSAAAIGIHCAGDANNVTLENVVASGNYGSHPALGAGGILFADTDTNSGLTFKNVVASNNTVTGTNPGTYAFGIKLNSAKSLVASDINCSYNVGPNATQTTNVATAGSWNTVSSVGMWLDTPVAVQLGNVTCDYNGVGSNTAQAYVFGLLLDNPSSVIIDSISCSNNAGNALGAGLFANGGSSVFVTNGLFNNNTSVAARVTTSAVISSGVNLSKHTVTPVLTVTDDYDDTFNNPELLKGSYGIVMDSTDNVTLDTVTASQNSGFRAFGVQLRSCNGVQMKDCITNQQSATGALFYDSARTAILDEGTNGSAVPVPDYGASAPDIFGSDILKTQTVNLQYVTRNFLDAVTHLKEASETPEIIGNINTMYGYHKLFVETSMLLRAIVAQARTWGVAVGTQLNNCSDVVITNLTACGNNSDKDSAFGLIFANNCTDCKVYGGQFNNNEAWAASDLGHTFANTIDIRAMNQFWAALDVDMLDFNSTGYVASSDAHYGKLNFLTDANATTGRLAVRLTDDTISELCTPCGPMAAGIVIGDTTARVDIADVTCAGNKGNAGQAYGLMHDVSVGASVQNSRFFQNMSNTCGIAFGLADFTPQSLSVHLGNTAFGNQYHVFMDSNYIVPFHPGAPYNLEFPVKVGYNGNITELANASPYDNIEIRFIYNAPTDPTNLPDGVFADWEDLNFVSSGDGHLNFEYNSPNLTFATQAFADSTTDFTDFALTMGTSANPTTTTDVYTGYTVGTGTKVYIGGTMKYFGADGEKVTVYVGGLGSYTYITRTPSQGSTSNGFLHVYSDAAKTNELFVIPLNASTFTSDIVP